AAGASRPTRPRRGAERAGHRAQPGRPGRAAARRRSPRSRGRLAARSRGPRGDQGRRPRRRGGAGAGRRRPDLPAADGDPPRRRPAPGRDRKRTAPVAGAGGMRRARRGPAPRRRTHPGRTGRRRRSAGAAAPGTLYVYALLRARPRGGVPRGLGGEPVRLVGGAGLLAAVGALPAPPAPTPAALRRHDATVRRLAARAGAVLPVRFGTVVASAADLAARLAPLAPAARR